MFFKAQDMCSMNEANTHPGTSLERRKAHNKEYTQGRMTCVLENRKYYMQRETWNDIL